VSDAQVWIIPDQRCQRVDWSVAPRHFICAFLATEAVSLTSKSQVPVPASFCRIRPPGWLLIVVSYAPPLSVCLRVRRESNWASPLRGRAAGCAEAPHAGLPPRGRPSLTQDRASLPTATTARPIWQILKLSSTPFRRALARRRFHRACRFQPTASSSQPSPKLSPIRK
jgi:hypothetical protein